MSNKSKSELLSQGCQICGAPAEHGYFGVTSCSPCKMFFKRNARTNQDSLVCDFGGQCEININTRHICSACRLIKCFQCGMNTDRFRPSMQLKPKKKKLVEVQAQSAPVRLPTLNLLQSDKSLLTTGQWTLLSNLSHYYKEDEMQHSIQPLIDRHENLESSFTIYAGLVEQFFISVYNTAGLYLRSNDDIRKLSQNERTVMVRTAGNNVCCMGGAFIMHNYLLYGLRSFFAAMKRKYGEQTMNIHMSARKFIDIDTVVIKLAISLFAFSENTCCYCTSLTEELTNPIHILEIQNKYAEITWKYLLYKYGDKDAVKRFLNLILWLLSMSTLVTHSQSLAVHINDIDQVIEDTELNLLLDDVEEMNETYRQE